MPKSQQKKGHSRVPNQRQTLDHFFSATPTSKADTSKTGHSKSANLPPINRRPFDSEIIVVDSDSDGEVEFVETRDVKKRKLNPQSAGKHHISKSNESSTKPGQRYAANRVSHDGEVPFGTPFLLLDTKPKEQIQDEEVPSFGTPHLLGGFLQPTKKQLETHNQENRSLASTAGPSSMVIEGDQSVDIDLTLDDWQNGDDEDTVEIVIKSDDEECLNDEGDQKDKSNKVVYCSDWDDGIANATFLPTPSESKDTPVAAIPHAVPAPLLAAKLSASPRELISCDGKRSTHVDNAFSVLMTSLKENEIWKEADIAQRDTVNRLSSKSERRKAPFYKVLQGMPIAVDAFKYGAIPGVTAYFLTHAHSDHYTNLSSSWKHGPIYCSEGTANLIIHMLSVDRKWVHPLQMDTPTTIPNTNGVTVTLIEANHCPGSCLFLFEGRQTVNAGDSTYKAPSVGSQKLFRYLHCGDFRASPRHVLHPAVKGKVIDHVYLDTTYLDPKYTFPPQSLVISACADLVKRLINGQSANDKNSTMLSWVSSSDFKGKGKELSRPLFVVGTYSIGKERVVKAIAHALNSKVYCDGRKAAILTCQSDSELDVLLTNNPRDAMVHLVPLGTINFEDLRRYLDRFNGFYTKIIGFRPTGWTFVPAAGKNTFPSVSSILTQASSKRDYQYTDLKVSNKSTSTLQVYPVPYSEHSSFYELTCFAMSFNWVKMIATVNVGSESSRGKMKHWVDKWEAERKRRVQDTMIPYRHPDYW